MKKLLAIAPLQLVQHSQYPENWGYVIMRLQFGWVHFWLYWDIGQLNGLIKRTGIFGVVIRF